MPKDCNSLRIFVVDDEYVISSTLTSIFCLHGFDATGFVEPVQALRAARTQAPDLLLTDIEMPLLSGIDLAIQVQADCPNCQILLFSGQSAAADLLELARSKGHRFEFIPKPVPPGILIRKVREMIVAAPISSPARKDPVHERLTRNMKQSLARVKADIAASEASKKPVRPNTTRSRLKSA